MSNLSKANNDLQKQITTDGLLKCEAFISGFLAVEPQPKEILVNKFANNSKYLPISNIEDKLDEIFFGAWQVKDFHYQVVANEIVGSLQLCIFHPFLQVWIERTGAAAVQIQMTSKEKGGDGDITNVRNKIINTLTKDFPHLKAACIMNAAKSLGKIFGRDLNRKADSLGFYDPIYSQEIDFQNAGEILSKINFCTTLEDLGLLFDSLEESEKQNKKIVKLFSARKAQINTGTIL
ncbi:MAG: hypothetical protein FWD66_00935 [Paludibacter sp.]|nr:hypothetical protein [Paludibacter sp.]